MSSKKASLLSLGVCLPAQPCLSAQASLLPTHLQLQLYALGWPKSGPAPLLPAPPPHLSYHQGQQCLEREDWEMAVLYFSRALHLNSQLVSGGHGRLLTHTLPSPLNLPGPFSRSLLVTEHQASADSGEGTQPGSSLPQVDFYALRAEAYIQLCAWGCRRPTQGARLTPKPVGSPFSCGGFRCSRDQLRLSRDLLVPSVPAAPLVASPTSRAG